MRKRLTISIGLFGRRDLWRWSPADARVHCHSQTGSFIRKEKPGKECENFSLRLIHCTLVGEVKELGHVLVQVLGNRMLHSWINGKNRTLVGVVKELGLVFWHLCWETRCFPWGGGWSHLYWSQTTLRSRI
jgi:hypothetical protein